MCQLSFRLITKEGTPFSAKCEVYLSVSLLKRNSSWKEISAPVGCRGNLEQVMRAFGEGCSVFAPFSDKYKMKWIDQGRASIVIGVLEQQQNQFVGESILLITAVCPFFLYGLHLLFSPCSFLLIMLMLRALALTGLDCLMIDANSYFTPVSLPPGFH